MAKIAELIGGTPEFIECADGLTLAARKDRVGLPSNKHYPTLNGDVLLGKMLGTDFVGALGVEVASGTPSWRT
jgi:hypothetical protein